jgi:hypothetical protein
MPILLAVAASILGGLMFLVRPQDLAPTAWELLAWTAWWALLVALPGVFARNGRAAPVEGRRALLCAACAVSFLGFALLVNPFFALLAAGYPLLVLAWMPLGRTRRRFARLLLGLWALAALAALLLGGVASVLFPEIVPPREAALATSLTLLPIAVALVWLR